MSPYPLSRERIDTHLRDLVSINSVNPDLHAHAPGEGEIACYLADACCELGLAVEQQPIAPGRPNVIAHWPASSPGRSLLLTGHMDVVGAPRDSSQSFQPKNANGRLYGRGAYDMKGGLAAILGAISALKEADFQPKGDLWLAFVCDEEYASKGTEALVKTLRVDAAILTEPTEETISTAHRGFVWLRIRTIGHAAHGSDFEEGRDAIGMMAPILEHLRRLEEKIYPANPHPLLGRASVHASLIEGGQGLSSYPEHCELHIEHRTLPGESSADILTDWRKQLQAIHRENPRFYAEVQLEFERPPLEMPEDEEIIQTLALAYQESLKSEPQYGASFGWLDSALLFQAGIPTAIFGPCGGGAHAAVEWVDLESVYRCAAVLAETCARWCQ